MHYNKVWNYNKIEEKDVQDISRELNISDFLARIFSNRGMKDKITIAEFLNPCLEKLNNPFLLNDMNICVEKIIHTLRADEKIVIFGDYDVDGITSTAILYDFLTKLGGKAEYYIPDRNTEGYGLSLQAVDNILKLKPSLVITVDCGITSIEEVEYIKDKNIDVIITDHHECKEILPRACAVINPTREDSGYPFKHLAGVGVTFKVIMAMCEKMNLGERYLDYIEIVSLGTIADVVELTGENRVIVKNGLDRIADSKNWGIRELINVSGLEGKEITSYSVGFNLAPRLNAAGRLGDAKKGVRLLITDDREEAKKIAQELNEQNKLRQTTEMLIIKEVLDKIQSEIDLKEDKIIVVSGEGWHHGVIGIVASRVTEKYYKPCIVLSIEDGIAKGSARSIKNFNLFSALKECEELLEKFGGHEMAAGLTLKEENIQKFRYRINEYAKEKLTEEDMKPSLDIIMDIQKNDITKENVRQLEKLKPFGMGNPVPVFSCLGMKVLNSRAVGNECKHLKMVLGDDNFFKVDAIGFNFGELKNKININDNIDVAFELSINVWNCMENVQMILKDIKLCRQYKNVFKL